MVKRKFCQAGFVQKSKKTDWATTAGVFTTKEKSKVLFQLLEYLVKTKIELDCHVCENDNLGTYDMVMGQDALNDLKIKLDFENKVISWEDEDLPMKDSESIINMNKNKMLSIFMTVIE